jgi:single-stranded DNA-binding protein
MSTEIKASGFVYNLEQRQTKDGQAFITWDLGVFPKVRDKTGKWVDNPRYEAEWYKCSAFNENALEFAKVLKERQSISVLGDRHVSVYTGKDGTNHTNNEIVVHLIGNIKQPVDKTQGKQFAAYSNKQSPKQFNQYNYQNKPQRQTPPQSFQYEDDIPAPF